MSQGVFVKADAEIRVSFGPRIRDRVGQGHRATVVVPSQPEGPEHVAGHRDAKVLVDESHRVEMALEEVERVQRIHQEPLLVGRKIDYPERLRQVTELLRDGTDRGTAPSRRRPGKDPVPELPEELAPDQAPHAGPGARIRGASERPDRPLEIAQGLVVLPTTEERFADLTVEHRPLEGRPALPE